MIALSLLSLLLLELPPMRADTAQTLSRNNIIFGTCFDAPPENKLENSCLHHCAEEGECADLIFSCYPHDFCAVRCSGDHSCHNITLLSSSNRIDTISLTCDGVNACQNVRFQTFDITLSFEQNLRMYMPRYALELQNFYQDANDSKNDIDDSYETLEALIWQQVGGRKQTDKDEIDDADDTEDVTGNNMKNEVYVNSSVCGINGMNGMNAMQEMRATCGNSNEIDAEMQQMQQMQQKNKVIFDKNVRQEWVSPEYLKALQIEPIQFKMTLEPETFQVSEMSETDEISEIDELSAENERIFTRSELNVSSNEDFEFVAGDHFMLLKNYLSREFLEELQDLGRRLNATGENQEHREFGDDEGSPYHGHTVIYLNNELSPSTYNKFKTSMFGMFDLWQEAVATDANENESEKEMKLDELTGFIDVDIKKQYGLAHDWKHHRDRLHTYNARVIEFIDYALDGSLGWHTDDDSELTMVALLNEDAMFDGGTLQFKQSTLDTNIESIRLESGDLILFPSLADHRVLPVTSGTRQVLVIEWWDLPRNYFAGRHDAPAFLSELKAQNWKFETQSDMYWKVANIRTPYVFEQYNDPKATKLLSDMYDEDASESDKTVMLPHDVSFGDHFIQMHSMLPQEARDHIKYLHQECINFGDKSRRSETRKFGSAVGTDGKVHENIENIENDPNDAYANAAHQVTYMNDCFDENGMYDDLKDLMLAALDALHYACMVNDSIESCVEPNYVEDKFNKVWIKDENGNDNGTDLIMKDYYECYYVENERNLPMMRRFGWKHDWYSIFEGSNQMESRVIEYVTYGQEGTLGWHTDDDSVITMVVLLSDIDDFEGGKLEFRSHGGDKAIEEVYLDAGDVLIFPSMADHRVLPILSGERKVLVIEWWRRARNYFEGRLEPSDFEIKMRIKHSQTQSNQNER